MIIGPTLDIGLLLAYGFIGLLEFLIFSLDFNVILISLCIYLALHVSSWCT